MDNKKLIAGFGYQEGRISSWDGKRTYTASAPQLAKDCCDNGADEILIYDWSVTDEDHEAAIAVIKEVCREADAPVIAGGRVKRMEDVKKISLCRSQRCLFRYEQRRKCRYDQKRLRIALEKRRSMPICPQMLIWSR